MSGSTNASWSLGDMKSTPAIGEVDRVPLLVEHEEQVVLDVAELLLAGRQLAVGDVLELHLLHELLDARLLQHLQQALVLRAAELRLVELERGRRRCRPSSSSRSPSATSVFTSSRLPPHQPRDGRVVLARTARRSRCPTGPEMMSGVRASSISTESTSSTIA